MVTTADLSTPTDEKAMYKAKEMSVVKRVARKSFASGTFMTHYSLEVILSCLK